jgi:hypothetical protein
MQWCVKIESEGDIIEIIDFNGEKFNLINLKCWMIILIISVISALVYLLYLILYPVYSVFFVSIFFVILFVLYRENMTSSKGMLRKFSISDLEIEFLIPHKPQFVIMWNDFDSIEIILKVIDIKPFNKYEICFLSNVNRTCFDLTLYDFNREKIKEILFILKEQALLRAKKFKAVKERLISGIYLVEDLGI